MKKVIVIGAGPAGMMAAMTAGKENEVKVILLDGNNRLGKKLYITGKGRCNVTNAKDISEFFDFIPGNPQFLYSALYTYTNEDTMKFFEEEGIKLKVERGGRVFPQSDKSSDIIRGLSNGLKKANVKILLENKVTDIIMNEKKVKAVVVNGKQKIEGDYFIIATGGASYPATGSRGEGQVFAEKMGHKIVDLKPSLVPMDIEEDWVKELMGLSLRNVNVKIKRDKKTVYENQGEMLFTHFGVTGPLILSGSRFIRGDHKYILTIDLKPALDENKAFKNSLDALLPQKMIPIIIRLSGIDENKKVNEITKVERRNLVNLLKNLTMTISGLRPIDQAIVTSGGVSIKEIDPSTMKSKIVENVAFAGEVMDVDAFTGGYNVQIALATGFLAGSNI
ncbi:NAD(P)/FAD-dependent oxidoreductase [Clostridium sp.]|uniref:NAD(P)/FAD-dependent oxidoreductase n=1 Tax=Clostridium sp. TaxID=1506 RepID=UPI002908F1AF|nr:NAD(P)/FAD-dependent oxidoreductase [Clostridium sp.]MDU3354521.1 NAD(P)/FAD-dependent oxidoreductase [Clostridium sp.]